MMPDVLDKLKGDEIVDAYSDMLGVDPDIIASSEEVIAKRQSRQQQMEAQQQAAMAPQMMDMAKQANEIKTEDGGDMLTNLTRQFTQL